MQRTRPQSLTFRPLPCRSIPRIRAAVILASVILAAATAALAQSGTTTTLSVTSNGTPATTIRQSAPVTLTAAVIAPNGAPVSPGQVEFCELKQPLLRCTDIRLLATAQLSSTGTASYKFYPGPGTHSYQAIFLGTHNAAPGSSATSVLIVTPFYTTTTALTAGPQNGNGSYTLTANVTTSLGTLPPTGTITFVDQNNGNYVLGTATLVPNANGSPTSLSFAVAQSLPTPSVCLSVLAADVNSDGRPDIVVGLEPYAPNPGPFLDTVEVFLNKGDGTYVAQPLLPTTLKIIALTMGDFNGDGKPDLVAFGVNPGYPELPANELQVFLGNGDGTFRTGQAIANPNTSFQYPDLNPPPVPPPVITPRYPSLPSPTVAVGDFNGDGIADIVFTTGVKQTVAVYFGNGDGTFRAGPSTPAGVNPDGITVGDFNGDGKPDLAITSPVTFPNPTSVTILLGNGDGTFTAAPGVPYDSSQAAAIVAGDLNNDGILDLAVESWNAPGSVEVYLGKGDGTFTEAPLSPIRGFAPSGSSLAIGDFTGDGQADLATLGGGQYVSSLLGNGDGTFQPAMVTAVPSFYYPTVSSVATGDFVGSGLSGIVAANYANFSAIVLEPQASSVSSSTVLNNVFITGSFTHSIVAIYSGSTTYQPSTSPPVLLNAEGQATTVNLVLSPTTITYGQPVSMTATIVPTRSQNHNATGAVTFVYAGATLGTAPVVNGVATFTSTLLPIGTDTVAAVYSGDTNFASSGGSATEVVTGFPSASVLTSNPNPSFVGQSVTLTAAVTGVGSPAIPAGVVMFYDSATPIGQATLDATGHASISTSKLSLGLHSITFVYQGSLGFMASTSPAVLQQVNAQGSTATLTASPNPAAIGQAVTITAAVTLSSSGPAPGTVTFFDGATQIAQATLDSTGHASFTSTTLALGTHSLTAVYAGAAGFVGSTSQPVLEVINASGFTMTLSNPAITLPTHQHTTTAVTLTSTGNFADSIALTCGSLPANVTCIFKPTPAALAANQTATVSFYLDTSSILGARSLPGPLGPTHVHAPGQSAALATLALLLSPSGLLATRRRIRGLRLSLLPVAILSAAVFALSSCGGDIIIPILSAAPGTYIIPITATASTTHLTQTVNLTLTITP